MMSAAPEVWDIQRYSLELTIAAANLDQLEANGGVQVADIREAVRDFPPEHRLTAFSSLQSIQNRTALKKHEMTLRNLSANQQDDREHNRELRTFWTGIGLLVVALFVSCIAQVKDASTQLIIRVFAGLGLGLAVAYVPGFFSLSGEASHGNARVVFRSAGVFAALVMIYFFDPGWISNLIHNF